MLKIFTFERDPTKTKRKRETRTMIARLYL